MEALRWLADMKACWEPDLAVLFARLAGGPVVSTAAVRAVVRRWQRFGSGQDVRPLVEAERWFVGRPRIVRLTADGAALVGAPRRWSVTSPFVAVHTAQVARARLWLERELPRQGRQVDEWVSEREFRSRYAVAVRAGAHVPDAVLTVDNGHEIAVEVERSDKGARRTAQICVELAQAYRTVYYLVTDPQVARTARSAIERAGEAERKRGREPGHIDVITGPPEDLTEDEGEEAEG